MENSLDSILSATPATETQQAEPPQQEQQTQAEEVDKQETGEQEAGTPPEPQKDDPLEKHRKGLEAAATAERKKRQDAEARAEAAERRARELEALQQQRQQPAPQTDDPKPLRAEYATEDEWLDARDAWRDRERARESEANKEQQRQAELRTKAEQVIAQAMAIPGFDMTEFGKVPVSQPMMDAILESEVPGKLVHFLQTQPNEAHRIASLSAAKQIAALARIEDKLTAAEQAEESDEDDDAKVKPRLPQTLTQARNAKGRFEPAYSGPTPLNAILASK